ncbi:hypothetical protein ACIA8E_36720 [Streptomyces sp. NPDC051664]|uniref:hypothetical protein n=1 Tax=Streptomyces sp. NPDC051664 TaxID=3365668 RepID=UPI00379C5F8D
MDLDPATEEIFDNFPWRTPEQGAATSALLAASPLVDGVGGRCFENRNEALPHDPAAAADSPEPSGVASYAVDPESAERLRDASRQMLPL